MRKRPQAGFYYGIAAIPVLGAGIVGPDVFHASAETKQIVFLVCVLAAVLCLFVGFIVYSVHVRTRKLRIPGTPLMSGSTRKPIFGFSRGRSIEGREETNAPPKEHTRGMISLIGMLICGAGFVGFAILYFQQITPIES